MSESDAEEIERILQPSNLIVKDIKVLYLPFDTETEEQFSPSQQENLFGTPPHIVTLFQNSLLHICWHDSENKIFNITRIMLEEIISESVPSNNTSNKNERRFTMEIEESIPTTISVKMPFPKFGGCTIDEEENYYVLFAKNNSDGDFSPNLRLIKYNKSGREIGKFEPDISRNGYDVMKPIDAVTSKIVYGNGMVAIHLGKTQHKNQRDGLNHQSAILIVVNAKTLKEDKKLSTNWTASHSFDQRLIFDGEEFVSLDMADNYPRGFSIKKAGKDSKVIFTYKTQHFPDKKSYNDNNTYSELGGVVVLNDGYIILGSSEKSFDNSKAKVYLNDPRNLFIIKVVKDFELKPDIKKNGNIQKNMVSSEVVISKGENWEEIGFYDFNGNYNLQKKIGIIWLTNYKVLEENALRPKLIAKNNEEEFVVLWEKWSKDYFKSAYYSIIDREGKIIKDSIKLGGIRLPRSDEPISVNQKIIWVIGKKQEKLLRIYILDP